MGVGEGNLLWINILRDYSHYWKGLKRTSSMEGRYNQGRNQSDVGGTGVNVLLAKETGPWQGEG